MCIQFEEMEYFEIRLLMLHFFPWTLKIEKQANEKYKVSLK